MDGSYLHGVNLDWIPANILYSPSSIATLLSAHPGVGPSTAGHDLQMNRNKI